VEAPDGEVGAVGKHPGLRPQLGGRVGAVDPDVLSHVGHSERSLNVQLITGAGCQGAVSRQFLIYERSVNRPAGPSARTFGVPSWPSGTQERIRAADGRGAGSQADPA